MPQIRILTVDHKVSPALYEVVGLPDRRGFVSVRDQENRTYQIHKLRILDESLSPNTPVVVDIGGTFKASCPACLQFVEATSSCKAACPQHGTFDFIWLGEKQMSSATSPEPQQQRFVTSLDALRGVGELWTKTGVEFDHPQFEVKAHVLIVQAMDGSHKKICFNTYSGGFGQKSKGVDIEALLNNLPDGKGRQVGYVIKNVEQTRTQLRNKSYVHDVGG